MRLKLYESAVAFNASCRKYLLLEQEKNNMFIGNLDLAMSVNLDQKYVFGEVQNQGKTELLFMCSAKGQMLVYSPTHCTDKHLYEFLSKELAQVNSIKAEPRTADLFAEAYTRQTGRGHKTSMNMRILLLTQLRQIKLLHLEVKKITLEDNFALSPEQIQFIKESKVGHEGLYFLMKNGIPVSQAAIRRKVSMGGVYTPEEHRRRGYSSTLVYHLARCILAENPHCVVHTDAGNPASNQMYANMGFEHIGDMKEITVERALRTC